MIAILYIAGYITLGWCFYALSHPRDYVPDTNWEVPLLVAIWPFWVSFVLIVASIAVLGALFQRKKSG